MFWASLKPGHLFQIVPNSSPMLETTCCIMLYRISYCIICDQDRTPASRWTVTSQPGTVGLKNSDTGSRSPGFWGWACLLRHTLPGEGWTCSTWTHTHARTRHLEHALHNLGVSKQQCRSLDSNWTSRAAAAETLVLDWSHFQLSWLHDQIGRHCSLVSEEDKLGHPLFEHNWGYLYRTKPLPGHSWLGHDFTAFCLYGNSVFYCH